MKCIATKAGHGPSNPGLRWFRLNPCLELLLLHNSLSPGSVLSPSPTTIGRLHTSSVQFYLTLLTEFFKLYRKLRSLGTGKRINFTFSLDMFQLSTSGAFKNRHILLAIPSHIHRGTPYFSHPNLFHNHAQLMIKYQLSIIARIVKFVLKFK